MKAYIIKVFFKWWPFPKKYSIVSHSILKDIGALDLALENGATVLYTHVTKIRKLVFGPEYRQIMQERFMAEQAAKQAQQAPAVPAAPPSAPTLVPPPPAGPEVA